MIIIYLRLLVFIMRVSSEKIFRVNPDGSITIYRPIKIGGVTLSNVTFKGGVKIAGINLMELVGKEFDVEDPHAEVLVIKGYYK